MEAAKGLGTICRCFRGHDQPPIGLQPPWSVDSWLDAKTRNPTIGTTRLECPTPVDPSPPPIRAQQRICAGPGHKSQQTNVISPGLSANSGFMHSTPYNVAAKRDIYNNRDRHGR
jgi:hypothetical protein